MSSFNSKDGAIDSIADDIAGLQVRTFNSKDGAIDSYFHNMRL